VILRNEELKVNLAEKDKFFSIIAHDLRSPFNGFLGFTQILADDLQSLTMYELQKLTQSLRRSATNLFSLLSNLLEWSSMQRGLIAFSPEGYLLKPLLEESTEQLMETAKSKMISLNYQIADDLIVFADLNMFESIVRNLTSNAIKFTPKGGNIIISAKKVTDSMIEISVCDNGIGIPDEMIGDLFRLDVKTNRKGTDDEPSTGLGLILCQDFIKKNNGSISVVSKEGIGSTFSIRIPSGKI